MSDEIKEIINQLEIVARKHTIQVCEDGSKIETMPASAIDELRLNNYSSKLLLDYITNLQTIEREYSNLLSENAELQQENDDYKSKVEKAVKLIHNELDRFDCDGSMAVSMSISYFEEDLLNILQGVDKE